jgi:cellulose synthase operon protein C
MTRIAAIVAILACFPLSVAAAPEDGSPEGLRSKSLQRQELIAKLRRDIAKVAHSVEVTKELISRSRGAPFLPDIYLRLAELYVEQARYEFYLVHEELGEDSKGSAVAPTARLLKEKAVETYLRILADFPEYKDTDKVLFFLGHEYRELGEYPRLIEQYEKLVERFPNSPLVLDAYLVLGDYRFDQQDLGQAKLYYEKILRTPDSPVHDLANFKMAWVYLNQADYKEALRHLEAAVASKHDPDTATSRREKERLVNVKREALVDLAFAYTEVRKPKGSLKYFRDLALSRTNYLLALRKLARRYFIKQDLDSASMVYREIASLSYDAEENLDFLGRVYEAAKKLGRYDNVHDDVRAMLDALDHYRFDWRNSETERKSAEKDFEVFSRDLVTRAQTQALKSTNKALNPRVALAYTRYLDSFPQNEHYQEVVQNLADTLFDGKFFIRAGDRYESAAALSGEDKKVHEESLYNACVAFHEALKRLSELSRFDRIWAHQGLIKNGQAYVEAYPNSKRVPEIKLNIGRSYYESGDFDRAEGVFDEFVAAYPSHAESVVAAELILDGYAQRQDFAGLAEKARKLASISALGDQSFKNRLGDMAKQAEEKQLGEVILTASVERESGGTAGAQLRDYWEKNKSSPMAEKTLYSAFVQYKEARDFDKTFEIGNQFIGAYPKSQYLGDVFGTLSSFTMQIGEYDQAAVYLEEFYKRFPTDASAQRMLSQAGTIKQLIGDHRGAIGVFRELMSARGDRSKRIEYAQKAIESHLALEDWDGLATAAGDLVSLEPGSVKGHLMLGLAALNKNDAQRATIELKKAVGAGGRAATDDERDDAAQAAFLMGDLLFRDFQSTGTGDDVQAAAQAKAELLGRIEAALVDAVGYNSGRWAVAALHRAAMAYGQFADFLANAPPPAGLSAEELTQYRELVGQQVTGIRERSDEFFSTCVTKSRELNVFTSETLGCVNKGPAVAPPQVSAARGMPAGDRAAIKARLIKNPKDVQAIGSLADFFLVSGDPSRAKLAAARGLEVDERNANFHNKLGMADLLLNEPQDAYFEFERARDLNHPYAVANIVTLMVNFGNVKGAKRLVGSSELSDVPQSAPDLHPEAQAAIRKAQ